MLRRRGSPHPPELREQARELRRAGLSYSEIINKLGGAVPLATMQSWVSDIELTPAQKQEIGVRQAPHPPQIRERARELRRAGLTYPEIVAELGQEVAQGTLSNWLSDIESSHLTVSVCR